MTSFQRAAWLSVLLASPLLTGCVEGGRMVRIVETGAQGSAMTAEGAGSAEAASDYARCLELAMSDARGDGMFSALISLWAYHLARAELDRAVDVLDVLRQQLQGSREWFRPANRAGYGMIDWFRGHFDEAVDLLEQSRGELHGPRVDSEVDETWFVPNDPTASIHVAKARRSGR